MASGEALEGLLQDPRIWRMGSAADAHNSQGGFIPTGWPKLDEILGGGWPLGQLTEVLIDRPGTGELSLLLPALERLVPAGSAAAGRGGRVALIAPPHVPYAPALARAGLDPAGFLLAHPRGRRDVLWALEQVLHAHGCVAVFGWIDEAAGLALRRLQQAAAQSTVWTLLYRHARLQGNPSPAPLRLRLMRGAHPGCLRLHVIKRRGGASATTVISTG